MEFIDHFRLARRLFRALLSAFDLSVQFGGLSHATSEAGPAVIVMAGSEPVAQALLTSYYPRPFQAAVRHGIWKKPVLSALSSRLGLLELPRSRGGWLSWVRGAVRVLRAGGRVALFIPPDFSPSKKPAVEFAVAAMLCRATGCAFVPVASDGTDRALPPGCFFPRVASLRLLIGKPVIPRIDTAISSRNRDWATMFQTDLTIIQQRLLSCAVGIPEEPVRIEQAAPGAFQKES